MKRALEEGHETVGLSSRGCDREPLPTYFIARPANNEGIVVVGLDFSQASLESTGKKLNLELALVDPKGKLVNKTKDFPPGGEKVSISDPLLMAFGSKTFVMKPFFPKELQNEKAGKFALVAALDVTQVQAVIRENLAPRDGRRRSSRPSSRSPSACASRRSCRARSGA